MTSKWATRWGLSTNQVKINDVKRPLSVFAKNVSWQRIGTLGEWPIVGTYNRAEQRKGQSSILTTLVKIMRWDSTCSCPRRWWFWNKNHFSKNYLDLEIWDLYFKVKRVVEFRCSEQSRKNESVEDESLSKASMIDTFKKSSTCWIELFSTEHLGLDMVKLQPYVNLNCKGGKPHNSQHFVGFCPWCASLMWQYLQTFWHLNWCTPFIPLAIINDGWNFENTLTHGRLDLGFIRPETTFQSDH